MKLDGIGVFVSGGASGLGEATSRLLVERGARVAIADVNDEKAEALASELGDAAHAFHADVTDEAQVEAAVTGAPRGARRAAAGGGVRRHRLGRARRCPSGGPRSSSRSRPSYA